jgi:hypothetical protein
MKSEKNRYWWASRAATWLIVLTPVALEADETQPVTADNYFVVRVTSPLQRVLLGSVDGHNLTTYAEIDANSIVSSLDGFLGLRRALVEFSKVESQHHKCIKVMLDFGLTDQSNEGVETLYFDLIEGMARRVGYDQISVFGRWGDDRVWETLASDRLDQKQTSEENIGNEVVGVYPVQTALSRRLTDNADCYIRINVPPADKWRDEHLAVIVAAASRLQPNERNKVRFQVIDLNTSGFELPAGDVAKALHEIGYKEVVVGIQQGATDRVTTLRPGE